MSKILCIDIGSKETKVLEVELAPGKATILKAIEMRDMSTFMTDRGVLGDIQGFCASLAKTLADNSIEAKVARICSSALGMENKDISGDFNGVYDCKRNFKYKYGSNMMACSWQYFGEIARRNAPVQRLFMTMCRRDLLNELVKAMKDYAGLTIESVESEFTAITNLSKLHASDFETPATCVVNVGSSDMQCYYMVQGSLVGVKNISCDLAHLNRIIADKFNLGLSKATRLLYSIGAEKTLKNGSALVAAGVDSNQYYGVIECMVSDAAKTLTEQIETFKNKYRQSEVCIVLSGGIFSMPYLAKLFMSKCKGHPATLAEVTTGGYVLPKAEIDNKAEHTISSKFAGCIGLCLKDCFEYTVNLLVAPYMTQTCRRRFSYKTEPLSGWAVIAALVVVLAIVSLICLVGFSCSSILQSKDFC